MCAWASTPARRAAVGASLAGAPATWIVRLAPAPGEGAAHAAGAAAAPGAPQVPLPDRRAAAWLTVTAPGRAAAAALAPTLDALADAGHLHAARVLPAARAIVVTGDETARRELARRPEVRSVAPDRRHRLPAEALVAPFPAAGASSLARVRAPEAWRLGATGAGAVVAILDSGVDWRHPALAEGYRGRDGRHDHAWLDLADGPPGAREPFDPIGHGTHVAGIAVGRDRAAAWGVAPGAQWIAVRVFDAQGVATDATLLAGAEWLLAPTARDGSRPRPDLAPDVVNGSWNLENGADPLFDDILAAWRAVGIVAVFAAGNDEDGSGTYATVRAPGARPDALAVGALGAGDAIWPLSRGGPTFDGRVEPDLAAPGTGIRSSLPGGRYEASTGTSMAAPHVAGAAGLLRAAVPWLTSADVETALRAGARDLGPPGPDEVFGHGALDAAGSLAFALSAGRVVGRVGRPDGRALPGASVRALAPGWRAVEARAGSDGRYRLLLPAGDWTVTFAAPAQAPLDRLVAVVRDGTAVVDAVLGTPGGGRLVGRLSGRDGRPLAGTVAAVDPTGRARSSVGAGADGVYGLDLAPGPHVVRFAAAGHRAVTHTVAAAPGARVVRDVALRAAPNLLLVDADAWQAERIWPYIGRALDDAGYAYDVWTLDDIATRAPGGGDLAGYDLVWWAHLFGSPGSIDRLRGDRRVTDGLTAYVAGGGRLVVSGQDVGALDAAEGFFTARNAPAFYRDVLGARWMADAAAGRRFAGGGGPFSGVSGWLDDLRARAKGPRLSADVVAPAPSAEASITPLLDYADGTAAALGASGARGRRMVLAFGPESVGDRSAAAALADAVVGWLEPPSLDVEAPADVSPGGAATLRLTVRAGRGGGPAALEVAAPPTVALTAPAAWTADAGRVAWRGVLGPDAERTWIVDAALAPRAPGGPQSITVTLSADAWTATRVLTLVGRAPALEIHRLDVAPARPRPGDDALVRLVVHNAGPVGGPATVRLTPTAGWEPSGAPVTATAGAPRWRAGGADWRGDLLPGAAVTLTLAGRFAGPVGARVAFAAVVTAPLGVERTRAQTVTLGAPRPVLADPILVPAAVDAGSAFTLSVGVVNTGLLPGVARLTLRPPPGLAVRDGSPGDGAARRWALPLAAGAAARVETWIDVLPDAPSGPRALWVALDDDDAPPDPSGAAIDVRVRAPDLAPSSVRFAPAVPRGGQPLTITLRLVNAGDAPAVVHAVDALPPALTVSADAVGVTGGVVDVAAGVVAWDVAVPAGGAESLTMRARTGSALGPNAAIPHAWRLGTAAGTRVLSDTLRADPLTLDASSLERLLGVPRPGARLRYRLVAAADGVVDARDLEARVDLPWAAPVVWASLGERAGDGRSLTWRDRLAPGARRAVEFDLSLDEGLAPALALPITARLSATGVAARTLSDPVVVGAADGPRVKLALTPGMPRPGERARLAVAVRDAPAGRPTQLTLALPEGWRVDPATARAGAGPSPRWEAAGRRLEWTGAAGADGRVDLAVEAVFDAPVGARLTTVAAARDALGVAVDEVWRDVFGAAARLWLPAVGR